MQVDSSKFGSACSSSLAALVLCSDELALPLAFMCVVFLVYHAIACSSSYPVCQYPSEDKAFIINKPQWAVSEFKKHLHHKLHSQACW